ncbi:hypothetical protein AN958_00127 [Leucoagaricus sp. SymC.cos]|nr:hypothetical protein AN958_00127 [Leucoagaricus sp. SymC.cos]
MSMRHNLAGVERHREFDNQMPYVFLHSVCMRILHDAERIRPTKSTGWKPSRRKPRRRPFEFRSTKLRRHLHQYSAVCGSKAALQGLGGPGYILSQDSTPENTPSPQQSGYCTAHNSKKKPFESEIATSAEAGSHYAYLTTVQCISSWRKAADILRLNLVNPELARGASNATKSLMISRNWLKIFSVRKKAGGVTRRGWTATSYHA